MSVASIWEQRQIILGQARRQRSPRGFCIFFPKFRHKTSHLACTASESRLQVVGHGTISCHQSLEPAATQSTPPARWTSLYSTYLDFGGGEFPPPLFSSPLSSLPSPLEVGPPLRSRPCRPRKTYFGAFWAKTEWWVLAWLSVWSEVQTCIWPSWCHCHSLSLASVKSRLVLPFWYRLTLVVLKKCH